MLFKFELECSRKQARDDHRLAVSEQLSVYQNRFQILNDGRFDSFQENENVAPRAFRVLKILCLLLGASAQNRPDVIEKIQLEDLILADPNALSDIDFPLRDV